MFEWLEWLLMGAAGWRYLFSPTYRRHVHSEWRHERWHYIAWDVLVGLLGMIATAVIAYILYDIAIAGR